MQIARLRDETSQIVIVHLSDLHFGDAHRFRPPATASGDRPADPHFPTLLEKLAADLDGPDPGCPVVVAITGDLVQTGAYDEFKQAQEFIEGLARTPIFHLVRGIDSIFVVPGNHDIKFDSDDVDERWLQWTRFFADTFDNGHSRKHPNDFAEVREVRDGHDEIRAVIVSLNSSVYVQEGHAERDRGNLDTEQLARLEAELKGIDPQRLSRAIKIALIHHHPVLIPPFVEPNRGYDAVHNSGRMLSLLHDHGFHAILHGHKHIPHTLTYDTRSAYEDRPSHPIVIVAGGSVGSNSLPDNPRMTNCYNLVTVKWHPAGQQSRVRTETRGLLRFDDRSVELSPARWAWKAMAVDDRHFGLDRAPSPKNPEIRSFDSNRDGEHEEARHEEYRKTRGNIPVAFVRPSLTYGQAYEVVLWIVHHPFGETPEEVSLPVEVTWSPGAKFEVITVDRSKDPDFCATTEYYGPMLVQARLKFADNYEALTHVYARMPVTYG